MKQTLAVLVFLCLAAPAFARPVRVWSYEELFKESDVVAIVKVIDIRDTTANLHGRVDRSIQGKRARLRVGLILKGEKQDVLTLDFFAMTPPLRGDMVPNGFFFLDFSRADKVHYLVFLKKTAEGSLLPVSGHDDAAFSVRELAPQGVEIMEPSPKTPAPR
jgi:hypothetical protein